jgi:energy-coupling factor transporter ATP-binding protein EcfA2
MQLISQIKIKNFRSIRSVTIDGTTDFTCFCGQNNAGKSNILKALNLFFNSQTDPGKALSIDADFNTTERKTKKKAVIAVEVTFNLPATFSFRNELSSVKALLGTEFSIEKTWTRDLPEPAIKLNGKTLDPANAELARQFLALIRFRYIPNRVLPIDIIRSEQKAITDSLIRRLKFSADESNKVFDHFKEQAAALSANLGSEFSELISNFSNVSLNTPQAWGDLIFNLGYRVSGSDDEVQGSGAQSVLMLETLALVDRDYYKQFGWRQATIWGFEEPESSLHHSLEFGVAKKISALTQSDKARLQIFCTTHSNAIVEFATSRFFVKRGVDGSSDVIAMLDADHIEEIWSSGVAPWIHPLLRNPGQTIIIFEGQFDVDIFNVLKGFLPGGLGLQAHCLATLDKVNATGGDSRLLQYLQNNVTAIKHREGKGDIIVVLDWDSAGKVHSYQRITDSKSYKVAAWTESDLNTELSTDFKGIERALSSDLIKSVAAAHGISLIDRNGQIALHPQDYKPLKSHLNDRVVEGVSPEHMTRPLTFFKKLLSPVIKA